MAILELKERMWRSRICSCLPEERVRSALVANSDTSATDLLLILISFTFRSCFPREKSPNHPMLMLIDDFNSRRLVNSLLSSLLCCCRVEIRVHCGSQMSDVGENATLGSESFDFSIIFALSLQPRLRLGCDIDSILHSAIDPTV